MNNGSRLMCSTWTCAGRDHGCVRGEGFTAGRALLALAGFWTAGVVMLVASLYGSVT
jgi:hypothetical protein